MTPSRPIRGEIVGAFGCGVICRGFEWARWYSRCKSVDVTSTYRIVISGSAWPSNFISAGKVTLERIISVSYTHLRRTDFPPSYRGSRIPDGFPSPVPPDSRSMLASEQASTPCSCQATSQRTPISSAAAPLFHDVFILTTGHLRPPIILLRRERPCKKQTARMRSDSRFNSVSRFFLGVVRAKRTVAMQGRRARAGLSLIHI